MIQSKHKNLTNYILIECLIMSIFIEFFDDVYMYVLVEIIETIG